MAGAGFGVLGPFEVAVDGRAVDLGGVRLRTVLALLVAEVGRVVSVAALVDALWGTEPPPVAARTVRSYVSRVRAALGPVGVDLVVTRPPGYLLRADSDAVDAVRFERLAAAGSRSLAAGRPVAEQELTAALALWRGEAYGEFGGVPALAAEAARLGQVWLAAVTDRTDARLAAGAGGELVAELEGLTRLHPGHERLWGQLMTALWRGGRQSDALAVFQRARQVLVEEAGVEPSPALVDVHRRVLAQDHGLLAPLPPVRGPLPVAAGPAQLPPAVPGFSGRGAELARLDALLAGATAPTAVVISAVSGTAGVGKTALAVHWAQQVADRFPDGQLFVNLRGFDPGGQVDPATAVRGFLDALGVPPQRVPADLDAQTALYRSVLAGKRVLVVLDNARTVDQVRPLLPGAAGSLVVVTSRNELTGLLALDGARPLTVDVLSPAGARELLAARLGTDRVVAEPEAVEEIVARCARLPLALAVVAARAATRPALPLAALAGELRGSDSGLAALSGAGDPHADLRAVFSWSYRALTRGAARLFRLLGLHPGPDISAAAAAGLAAVPPARVTALLAELTRASLLAEHAPNRYICHDLLRAYATDLAHAVDSDREREAAVDRMLDHYLHTACAAAELLDRSRDPLIFPLAAPAPDCSPRGLADRDEAMSWLTAEHPVLLAALALAAGTGRDAYCNQLAWALVTFHTQEARCSDLATAWEHALAAARRLGSPAAQAQAHRLLSLAATPMRRYREAETHLSRALELSTAGGDPVGQAHVHLNLGDLAEREGSPDRALFHAQRALTLYRTAGHPHGQAHALSEIGWYQALLGDHTHALMHGQQALTELQRLGDRYGEAHTWDSLGYINHHLDRHPESVSCYQHALAVYRDLGARYQEAFTLIRLGDIHRAAGDTAAAAGAWERALAIFTEVDLPDADTVRARLDSIRPPTRLR